MPAKLTPKERLRLVKRALKGKNISVLCKDAGVSRTLLYRFLKRYREQTTNSIISLTPKRPQIGEKRLVSEENTKRILIIILKNPEYSIKKIVENLPYDEAGRPVVGYHGVQNVLERFGLSTFEKRKNFQTQPEKFEELFRLYSQKDQRPQILSSGKLTPRQRQIMIERVKLGEPANKVCQEFNISKPVFYRWLARYEGAPVGKKLEALWDKKPKISKYFNQAPEEYEEAVLSAVRQYPELSSHKLVWVLPQIGGRPIVSNHGVQNILRRHNLATYEQRLAYAKLYQRKTWAGELLGAFQNVLSFVLSQKPAVRTFLVRGTFAVGFGIFLGVIFRGISSLVSLVFGAPSLVYSLGTIFSLTSLFFGMLFFIYSLKYYLTIAIVLSFSRRNPSAGSGQGSGEERSLNQVPGLRSDISNIHLERHPFVSIHIATYNEKRVIERLLKAASGIDYENYEVVIVDDSNDETTSIIEQFTQQWNSKLKAQSAKLQLKTQNFSSPYIKVIHRNTREGFKGGALKEALKHTDKRAEFVVVLDADFIPYPDTIVQFLKYFQVTAGTLDFRKVSKVSEVPKVSEGVRSPFDTFDTFPTFDTSPIAAIQGYQWHVLNKSENWITRGVRSEYSGSYVIERSGEEIYEGLKQISGSVYMIRRDVLDSIGWGTSITEDFQLTLKLYELGYKVVYTPYIQAPAEAVSTIKRLIRQRMRWAEGHSHNVRRMFTRLLFGRWEEDLKIEDGRLKIGVENRSLKVDTLSSTLQPQNLPSTLNHLPSKQRAWIPSPLTLPEKLEFLYLSPYYLQAAFFILGTLSWFIAEVIFKVRLPFWTEVWGWSLVFTNLLALPLTNMVGLFMEESSEKDYLGLFSFVALSYITAPFQGYAALKGFLAKEEGPWFRTPKTGRITDTFIPGRLYRFVRGIFGGRVATSPTLSTTNSSLMATNLAFVSAHNNFSNFRIKRRTVRWVGNTTLVLFILLGLMLTNFAQYIPVSSLENSTRRFQSIAQAQESKTRDEIKGPSIVRYPVSQDKVLEYIFHQEPRVRTKYDGKELEFELIGSDVLGKALPQKAEKENGRYVYREVFNNVDVEITPSAQKLSEEIIFKKYQEFGSIDYRIKTDQLVVALRDNMVYFAPEEGGNPMFSFTKPYLYEKNKPANKSMGVEYILQKTTFGWTLKKQLTQEGKKWFSDPNRIFPVVLDPTQTTSTIQTAVSAAEADYGQQQRKIVWANGALNGDAWYAIYEDATQILYEKCVPSVDGCETGTDWTDQTDIDGVTSNVYNPSVWWESDRAKMWVVWASNAADNLAFVDIDVDASDPGTAGTICTGADQANHNPTTWQVSITVDSSDTIYVSYVDTSTSTVNNMYRIATGGCTFTAILTSSGVDAGDRPILLATGTQTLHAIFQDGTTLRHSVYVNDGTPGWDSADTDITGAAADNTTTNYSAATDGTDIWLIADQGTSGVDLWTCAACAASSSWTDASDPWTSQGTDITEVSLGYSSETDDIIAFALRGSGSTEEAIVESTDSTSISWGSESSLGVFGGGASGLEDLSATMSTNADDKSAFVVEDATNSELEFSTVPENLWLLLLLTAFLPALTRVRRGRPKTLIKHRRSRLDLDKNKLRHCHLRRAI